MRVLLTTDTVGGVWTFTQELVQGLLEHKHAVVLISFGRPPSRSQCEWVARMEDRYRSDFLFEASDVPLEWMDCNDGAYTHAESLLLRMITEFGVDLLHSSQFCFGALPTNVPKLLTAHSDVFSWAEACHPGSLEESAWLCRYRSLVNAGIVGADAMVTPTRWMCDALARHYPGCHRARVIENGRSLRLLAGSTSRRLQAVTVGRLWDRAKGLSVLSGLEACMPVMVAGEVHFERSQAPDTEVVFLGRLEEDELLEILRDSSLYLATSIYEPFGMAPLEAAICGCGVVARDIPSLREVWGESAEYFTDSSDLCSLLCRLRDSPRRLEALRGRSRKRALELPAIRMIEGYLTQYDDLLSMKTPSEEVASYVA